MTHHPYRLGLLLAVLGILARACVEIVFPVQDDGLDAQSIVATYDTGRFYNYGLGTWTLGHVSGIEVSRGVFSVAGSLSLDRSGIFEKAVSCLISTERGRFTFSGTAGLYHYPSIGNDYVGSVGVRVTLH